MQQTNDKVAAKNSASEFQSKCQAEWEENAEKLAIFCNFQNENLIANALHTHKNATKQLRIETTKLSCCCLLRFRFCIAATLFDLWQFHLFFF